MLQNIWGVSNQEIQPDEASVDIWKDSSWLRCIEQGRVIIEDEGFDIKGKEKSLRFDTSNISNIEIEKKQIQISYKGDDDGSSSDLFCIQVPNRELLSSLSSFITSKLVSRSQMQVDLKSSLANTNVTLWGLDDSTGNWIETCENGWILMDNNRFVVKSVISDNSYIFDIRNIYKFRQHDRDMTQWNYRISATKFSEHGLVFSSVPLTISFSQWLHEKLVEDKNNEVKDIFKVDKEAAFMEYDRSEKEWVVRVENAALCIRTREVHREAYLVVFDADNVVISEICIGNDTCLFPQPSERQVCWWGSLGYDSADASPYVRMFGIRFNDSFDDRIMIVFYRILEAVKNQHGADLDAYIQTIIASAYHSSNRHNTATTRTSKIRVKPNCVEDEDMDLQMGYDAAAFDMGPDRQDSDDFMDIDNSEEEEGGEGKDCVPEGKNSIELSHRALEVGRNRAFVVRSAAKNPTAPLKTLMEVLSLENTGHNHVVATIDGSKFKYGDHCIDPSKILLHQGDSKMLVTDVSNKESVYMMDLETEKVVQEWTSNNLPINNIMSSDKSRRNERSFIGYNAQSLFSIDTRLQAKSARQTTLSYTAKTQFTCGGTDNEGHIVLGNQIGDIRLYDGEANAEGKYKRAKTQLGGLGDPLLFVTCTKNGDWILGTCAQYLVLFPVKLQESGRTGFTTALGKKKPKPILLKLQLQDVIKYNLQNVKFAKAEFDGRETNIITATANLIIIWDFRAIKQGNATGSYQIRPIEDYVKDVGFIQNEHTEAIIAATPSTVSTKAVSRTKKST